MKLVSVLALATMAATAAPAFADSVVPGSDAAFYSQATPAPTPAAGSSARYGMPRTAAMNAARSSASSDDLVPGSDADFVVATPTAVVHHASAQPATGIAPDMVPGSDAAFLN